MNILLSGEAGPSPPQADLGHLPPHFLELLPLLRCPVQDALPSRPLSGSVVSPSCFLPLEPTELSPCP